MKNVTLKKIATVEGSKSPGKPVGYERSGRFNGLPEVGKHFIVGTGTQGYRTSAVLEVMPDHQFRTYNSIYQYRIHD